MYLFVDKTEAKKFTFFFSLSTYVCICEYLAIRRIINFNVFFSYAKSVFFPGNFVQFALNFILWQMKEKKCAYSTNNCAKVR